MTIGDPYKVLGIQPNASAAEIRKAYRALVKKYHPDKNKSEDAAAHFLAIQEAYEQISTGQVINPATVAQQQQKTQASYAEDLEAYRIRREATREKLRQKQQKEEAYRLAYLNKLKSGKNGLWHRFVAYAGIILTFVLWIDYFLPAKQNPILVKAYGIHTYGSVDGHSVQLFESTDGRYFWTADYYTQQLTKVKALASIDTPWLHQAKALGFQDGLYYKTVPIHFSFYWAQIWLSLLFLLPFICWRWASADIIFVAGSVVSRYLILGLIILFLSTENRFLHLFTLGYL